MAGGPGAYVFGAEEKKELMDVIVCPYKDELMNLWLVDCFLLQNANQFLLKSPEVVQWVF